MRPLATVGVSRSIGVEFPQLPQGGLSRLRDVVDGVVIECRHGALLLHRTEEISAAVRGPVLIKEVSQPIARAAVAAPQELRVREEMLGGERSVTMELLQPQHITLSQRN